MVHMTLDRVDITQSSFIRINYRYHNVGLTCFFIFLNFCYYHQFLLTFAYGTALAALPCIETLEHN